MAMMRRRCLRAYLSVSAREDSGSSARERVEGRAAAASSTRLRRRLRPVTRQIDIDVSPLCESRYGRRDGLTGATHCILKRHGLR